MVIKAIKLVSNFYAILRERERETKKAVIFRKVINGM